MLAHARAMLEDLRGRVLLGIHWETFDRSEEPVAEPPERMLAEAKRRGVSSERAWIFNWERRGIGDVAAFGSP